MSQKDTQPKLRWTIARKIGGLSAILIIFIIIILVYTITVLNGLEKELKEIAELDVPLTELSVATEVNQLEQHIIWEELLLLLNSPAKKRLTTKNEIIKKHNRFNEGIDEHIDLGIKLAEKGFESDSQSEFQKIQKAFIQLAKEHQNYDKKFQKVISLLHLNQQPDSKIIEELKEQDEVLDQHAIALVEEIEKFTQRGSVIAEKHEQAFFVVNITITIAAILLGILLSSIIVAGIRSNIFRLSKGIAEVTKAISEDKSISHDKIKINSTDELSGLAGELLKMVDTVSKDRSKKEELSKSVKEEAESYRSQNLELTKLNEEISEQQSEIASQMNELETLLDSYKDLNRIMSHDLANPIGFIYGVMQMAEKDITIFERMKESIWTSVNSCLQIIDLVKQMRALDEGKLEIKLEPFALKEMIEESIQILDQKITAKNIDLEININSGFRVIVERVSFVNSVVNNLLTNAIKFSEPDSKIIISAQDNEDWIKLSIRDFGIGMPESLVKDVFDINKPTSRKGTKGEPGTGFGMPLVNKFVTTYEGNINIVSKEKSESETNHGTEVNVLLKKGKV